MKTGTKSETIIVRVDEEIKKDLQKLADADKRKLSDYVRLVLEDHVNIDKKKK